MSSICYTLSDRRKSEYERIESKCGSTYNRRCIDGRITGCGNCVGYCKFSEHPGFLTKEHRKKHNCIGKGCHYYVPKEKRAPENKPKSNSNHVLKIAIDCSAFMEGLRIMSANQTSTGTWILNYITISNEYSIEGLTREIECKCGAPVALRLLACDYEKAVQLLYEV